MLVNRQQKGPERLYRIESLKGSAPVFENQGLCQFLDIVAGPIIR